MRGSGLSGCNQPVKTMIPVPEHFSHLRIEIGLSVAVNQHQAISEALEMLMKIMPVAVLASPAVNEVMDNMVTTSRLAWLEVEASLDQRCADEATDQLLKDVLGL